MQVEYPVELRSPDISPYRAGNCGIDFVWTFDSGKPGPHLLISALVHGNEICGAHALDFLLSRQVRPFRGRLTLAFMNVAAFLSFDPARPSASRYLEEDFNRLWDVETLDGPRDSLELRRARQLRPVVDSADILLDLHSMQHNAEPLALAGPLEKGRSLARSVGVPSLVVSDEGHANGRRMRDYCDFADVASHKNALLIECGQHWQSGTREVALEVVARCLHHLRMIERSAAGAHLEGCPPPQRFVEVTHVITVKSERFYFVQDIRGGETIPKAGTTIAYDSAEAVCSPYNDCILIMPSQRLEPGLTAVRLGRALAA